MQTKNRILSIVGIILIVIQIAAFIGMSRVYVKLFPAGSDLLRPSYSQRDSGLNVGKSMYAVVAGLDRFRSSFEDLFSSKDNYRPMTSTQMTSAMIRESLGCSDGGGLGLLIYDALLIISYCTVGIAGVVILLIAVNKQNRFERRKPNWESDSIYKKTSQ